MKVKLIAVVDFVLSIVSCILNLIFFPLKMRSSIVLHDIEVDAAAAEERSLGACGLGSFSDDESDDLSTQQSDGDKKALPVQKSDELMRGISAIQGFEYKVSLFTNLFYLLGLGGHSQTLLCEIKE